MRQIIILLLFLLVSCYSLERDCKPFQNGKFKFTQIIDGELKTSFFTRNSLYEIELFEGNIDTSTIRWVNDCECILTKLNTFLTPGPTRCMPGALQNFLMTSVGDFFCFEPLMKLT